MIIYGSKGTQIGREQVTDQCPKCSSNNTTDLFVFQRYAHIFWIPFFPIGKTGASHCSSCKQVMKEKEMPAYLKATFQRVKAQSKTPIWTFLGVGVVAVLIVLGIVEDRKTTARNAQLILSPQAGDVFEFKTKDNNYTLIKVESVQGDSVFMRANNYQTDQSTALYKLTDKEYSNEIAGTTKATLKSMFDKGTIIGIRRK